MRMRLLMPLLAALSSPSLSLAADRQPAKNVSARVFGLDKVWSMHLTIAPEQWEKMQPKRGRGFGPPGAPPPREAKPAEGAGNKVRGRFGFDYEYVKGDLEIDGRTFKNVGVRYKGNGSYIASQGRLKRPFKIDFDRYNPGQTFAGRRENVHRLQGTSADAAR